MNRRTFLAALGTSGLARAGHAPGLASPETSRSTTMGVAEYSFHHTNRSKSTLNFLEHCHSLGAAGLQTALSSLDPDYIRRIRTSLETSGMYFEVSLSLPRKDDSGEFERRVKAAKDAGAVALRSNCLAERRYERFSTLGAWQSFVAESKASLAAALPVLEKERMPMGIENHKDWTVDELLALLKEYDSEYLGVCLDTGNNIALLDDPMDVVERLAPHAVATHLKDMAVAEYAEGFLVAEVPFGEGFLDMKRIVDTIAKDRPRTRLTLEMITRDPLKVPCLTDKYWATFPDRNGSYLARTLRMVRAHKSPRPLPEVESLGREAVIRLEEENVRRCLAYAREQLGLDSQGASSPTPEGGTR